MRVKVAFVLANPYSAPISAGSLDLHITRMDAADTAYRTIYFKIGSDFVYRKDFARFLDRFQH